jgi:hypothetical protein
VRLVKTQLNIETKLSKTPVFSQVPQHLVQLAKTNENVAKLIANPSPENIAAFNDRVKNAAVRFSIRLEREIFAKERFVIDVVIERVESALEGYQFRSDGMNGYTAFSKESLALMIPEMHEPLSYPDPVIDAAIKDAFENLKAERLAYFKSIKRRLGENGRMRALVRSELCDAGHTDCWNQIA